MKFSCLSNDNDILTSAPHVVAERNPEWYDPRELMAGIHIM
jgi:hypothetical protein